MSEFSDFTKLVLDRMETNPKEFEANNRWDTLVRALEARAIGDFENRYAKTLWALEPLEIEAIMAKYRKLYLDRIHKEMLKNIVSGEDLNRGQYTLSGDINPLTGGIMRGNGPLTTTAITNQASGTLGKAFDAAYSDTIAYGSAVAKMEGAQVPMSNTAAPKLSKYVLNRSQVEIAQRLNMTPWEYAKYAEAVAKHVNGGTE